MRTTKMGATVLALMWILSACDDGSTPGSDAGHAAQDSGPPPSCTAIGTYTGVRGGITASACGHSLTPFTDATLTVTEGTGGGALLTVTGTGDIGDVMDCEATISSGHQLTATCVHDDGSSANYTLTFDCIGFHGMASITTAGGGCTVPWSIEGNRT